MSNVELHTSRLGEWLLAQKRLGRTWAEIGAMLGVSRGYACLLATGKAKPTPALLATWRMRWYASPSRMRRLLPRLVRWLAGRQVREDGGDRVYGRGGRR